MSYEVSTMNMQINHPWKLELILYSSGIQFNIIMQLLIILILFLSGCYTKTRYHFIVNIIVATRMCFDLGSRMCQTVIKLGSCFR